MRPQIHDITEHEARSRRALAVAAAAFGYYVALMGTSDPVPDLAIEELFLGVAHALFVNRLHVLRLTEIVRLGIKPDPNDQNMDVPAEIDRELIQQAFAYTVHHFPPTFGAKIEAARARWIRLV